LAFLTQNKAKLCRFLIKTLFFKKNANFFRRKLAKIVIITSTPGRERHLRKVTIPDARRHDLPERRQNLDLRIAHLSLAFDEEGRLAADGNLLEAIAGLKKRSSG
jgi:hypothetical protein